MEEYLKKVELLENENSRYSRLQNDLLLNRNGNKEEKVTKGVKSDECY